MLLIFFFFQAEDGIRYRTVTGVQTCALPILLDDATFRPSECVGEHGCTGGRRGLGLDSLELLGSARPCSPQLLRQVARSEERRVGKECRGRGWGGRGRSKEWVGCVCWERSGV